MTWTFTLTRSDGEQFTLGPPPCRITGVEGADNGSYQLTTLESVAAAGTVVAKNRLPARQLEISGDLKYEDREALRSRMIRFFSPSLSGRLVSCRNGASRGIGYQVESLRFSQAHLGDPVAYTLRLYCPSPYWEDVTGQGRNLAASVPLIGFPLVIPWGKEPHGRGSRRFLTGYTTENRQAFLENKGDAPAGLRMVIAATRGRVAEPSVTLAETGETMLVHVTLEQGDQLELSTLPRNKRVLFNGENIFHKLDRSSVFFSIPTGGGTVEYSAQEGYTNLDLLLYYTPQYLGI